MVILTIHTNKMFPISIDGFFYIASFLSLTDLLEVLQIPSLAWVASYCFSRIQRITPKDFGPHQVHDHQICSILEHARNALLIDLSGIKIANFKKVIKSIGLCQHLQKVYLDYKQASPLVDGAGLTLPRSLTDISISGNIDEEHLQTLM